MEFLKKAWEWFDGKKTNIGAGVFFVAMILQQMGWIDAQTLATWEKLAEVVVGVGLAHKAKKNWM